MTVREFTSKCKNSFMCVDVRDHVTGKYVRDTTRVIDYVTAGQPDKNYSSYDFYKYLQEVLDRDVKEFKYAFDVCMGERFVLYV